jgi:hypothetical protein
MTKKFDWTAREAIWEPPTVHYRAPPPGRVWIIMGVLAAVAVILGGMIGLSGFAP